MAIYVRCGARREADPRSRKRHVALWDCWQFRSIVGFLWREDKKCSHSEFRYPLKKTFHCIYIVHCREENRELFTTQNPHLARVESQVFTALHWSKWGAATKLYRGLTSLSGVSYTPRSKLSKSKHSFFLIFGHKTKQYIKTILSLKTERRLKQ